MTDMLQQLDGLVRLIVDAVEKSLKAALLYERVAFPQVHSIERLVDLLPPTVERSADLVSAARLTEYATTFCYPGEGVQRGSFGGGAHRGVGLCLGP